ncbi:MAG: hypothetical protein Q8P08_00010 [bacterium]|nr:hypothetical protein [bacterium]
MYRTVSNAVALLALFSAIVIGIAFFYFSNLIPDIEDFQDIDSYARYLPQE